MDSDAAGAAVEGCGGEKWEVSKSVVGFKMSVCFWTDISFLFFLLSHLLALEVIVFYAACGLVVEFFPGLQCGAISLWFLQYLKPAIHLRCLTTMPCSSLMVLSNHNLICLATSSQISRVV